MNLVYDKFFGLGVPVDAALRDLQIGCAGSKVRVRFCFIGIRAG